MCYAPDALHAVLRSILSILTHGWRMEGVMGDDFKPDPR
jgi:hypothetical protein